MCGACPLGDAFDVIDDFPAADVQEVKHGHWIPQFVSSRGLTDKFVCSVCNTTSYTNHKYLNCSYKYCKECGVKMEMFGNPEEIK